MSKVRRLESDLRCICSFRIVLLEGAESHLHLVFIRDFVCFQMPPKKKEVEEKPIIIGRLGTNLKCGIVGLPNVGKSTFFNVLTKTTIAAAENFPFCTIDPNENKYRFHC